MAEAVSDTCVPEQGQWSVQDSSDYLALPLLDTSPGLTRPD